jgi:hypothetical protein
MRRQHTSRKSRRQHGQASPPSSPEWRRPVSNAVAAVRYAWTLRRWFAATAALDKALLTERVGKLASARLDSPSAHLLFVRENSLWAVAFDAMRLRAKGEPIRVVDNVQVNSGRLGLFAISSSRIPTANAF